MYYSGYKLEFEAFKKISRLMDVKLFKTAFNLIDNYYKLDEVKYLPHTDLSEAYPYLDKFCKSLAYLNPHKDSVSGNVFEDNEKYVMYNYIYNSKGSKESLEKIKRLTGVDIKLFNDNGEREDYGVYNRVELTFPDNSPIDYNNLVEIKLNIIDLLPDLIWRTENTLIPSNITLDNVIIVAEFYNNNIMNFSQNAINHVFIHDPQVGE